MADVSIWPQVVATFAGSAVGVVAGVLVQYGVQHFVDRRNALFQLKDISAEAVYNVSVIDELINEAGRLRASAQPGVLATYFGVFRFTDVLWISINRMVTIGRLYREFSHTEIEKIQKAMTFFRAG